MSDCEHIRVAPEVVDQTLGVCCLDCDMTLEWCWRERHVAESLWNRACLNSKSAVPCKQNRDDVCAICGESLE